MHIVLIILVGLVVGAIAIAITPDEAPAGFLMTAAVGIAGSLIATFAGQALHLYSEGHAAGFLASIVGAVVLLGAWHLLTRRQS